jgi:hypothetical protein
MKHDASISATIVNLQRRFRPLLERDRKEFLDHLVIRADGAMQNNDFRTGYAIVRALGGSAVKHNSMVVKTNGELTSTQEERDARWTEHFAEVFNGVEVPMQQMREEPRPVSTITGSLDVGPQATQHAFAKLGTNKGVGKDEIPAELLAAGGAPMGVLFSQVNLRIADNGSWPTQWRGGRMQPVHKKKGDPTVCDNSRGILLADHSGKGLTALIKDELDPDYTEHIPSNQYGAVALKGTDFASTLSARPSPMHHLQTLPSWSCSLTWSRPLIKRFVNSFMVGVQSSPPIPLLSWLR